MLELPFDNIVVVFGGKGFQQTVNIPISTNCAPLWTDIHVYLYSCDAEFIKSLLSTGKEQRHLSSSTTHCPYIIYLVCYVSRWAWDQRHDDDQRFCFLLASYLNLLLSIMRDGQLPTLIQVKRDGFYSISQTLHSWAAIFHHDQPMAFQTLFRACSSYECFILRAAWLSFKLLGQG